MNEARSAVDVTAVIDREKISGFQIRVACLCAAVVFMDGFDAQAIGYVAPTLSKAWQLPPGALTPVVAFGLIGLGLGALILSPLADRIGRRPVIIMSTLWFGACSLLTVTADSLTSLLIWRFLTGLGLGGAMPNPIALTCEYSPQRSRATMVMVMFVGFSLGSAVGGAVTARLVPVYGWTSVFWAGGLLPVVLVPILFAYLPESIRLLALRGTEDARIASLLRRINPQLAFADGAKFVSVEAHPSGFPVLHLFREGRAPATALLWVMFFCNLLDIYFMATWLPTVINNIGISVELAVITGAMFQVGGITGSLIYARVIDKFGPYRPLALSYFAAGLLVALIGSVGSSIELIIPAVFGAGFCIIGAQNGANALAATYYPTFIRSTGVGWALGIGRVGSIVGPTLGGMMLILQWNVPTIFLAGAVPVFIAAIAVFTMGRLETSGAPAAAAVSHKA